MRLNFGSMSLCKQKARVSSSVFRPEGSDQAVDLKGRGRREDASVESS